MSIFPVHFNTQAVQLLLSGNKTASATLFAHYNDNELKTSLHGRAGDLFWVREEFFLDTDDHIHFDESFLLQGTPIYKASHDNLNCYEWKESIYMPRWMSRITLNITNLYVMHLLDISDELALKLQKTDSPTPAKYFISEWVNKSNQTQDDLIKIIEFNVILKNIDTII